MLQSNRRVVSVLCNTCYKDMTINQNYYKSIGINKKKTKFVSFGLSFYVDFEVEILSFCPSVSKFLHRYKRKFLLQYYYNGRLYVPICGWQQSGADIHKRGQDFSVCNWQ